MATTVNDNELPELSHNQLTSSPDIDETCSLDGSCLHRSISQTHLLEGLESNTGKAQALDDDALFSQYLRSPSPSHSLTREDSYNLDNHISITSQTILIDQIC